MNYTHDTFNQVIANRYGAVWLEKVKVFTRLRVKCKKLECGLRYVVMCRDNGLVPKFARIKPVKCIRGYSDFFRVANEKFLRRVISDYRRNLMNTNKSVFVLHLEIANMLPQDLWETLDAMSFSRAEATTFNTTRRHDKKFQNLLNGTGNYLQKVNDIKVSSHSITNVVNLSSQELCENTLSVLSRGLNFAPAPKIIPKANIITSIEKGVIRNHIPHHDAECLRQDVATILRKSRPPKSNLSMGEFTALSALRNNSSVLVLPADKGNATVVVDAEDYDTKLTEMVSDEIIYKRVNYNPTLRITNRVLKLLRAQDDMELISRLRPYNPTSPKLYGLPKVHKPDWPLRPIVSQIDAPTYKMSKHMASILQRFTGKTDRHIKDSQHFVRLLTDLHILPEEVMVSFDVTSLFTNVPVGDTMTIISSLIQSTDLPTYYVDWADCCLNSGYFLWRGDHYLQMDGVAMGSPIAPVAANIFMEWFEDQALNTPDKPRLWWRYVDDVFAIIKKDILRPFLTHLNSVHSKINFTVEEEHEGLLPFLDVKVMRMPNGTVTRTVYRKPTHTDRYLRADSHHHHSQLASVPKSLIDRALRLCDPQYINTELDHLKRVLQENGYNWRQCWRWVKGAERERPTAVDRVPIYLPFVRGVTDKIGALLRRKYSIKTFYRPPGRIQQLLRSPKDKQPMQTPGVYQIPCDCGKSYIGETRRNISTRLTEHIRSVKNVDTGNSAVAEHARETGHFLRFDKASVLAKEKFLIPRKVREAIEITRHPNFNRDRGWTVAPAWKPVLAFKHTEEHPYVPRDTVSVVCTGLNIMTSSDEDEETSYDDSPSPEPAAPPLTARALRAQRRAARMTPDASMNEPPAECTRHIRR